MSPLTGACVSGVWDALRAEYGTVVLHKQGSPLMSAIGSALAVAGVLSKDRFMAQYTTVVAGRIYCPFVVGEGDSAALWAQLVTGVHEHQHVVQSRRDGAVSFSTSYVVSSRRRALYEAEAYGCGLELSRWAGRPTADPEQIASRLADYGCRPEDIAAAAAALRRYADGTQPRNEATARAIAVLEARRTPPSVHSAECA